MSREIYGKKNNFKMHSCSSEESSRLDEVLEKIWEISEEKGEELSKELLIDELQNEELLKELVDMNYVREVNGNYFLTEEGVTRARHLIRSHRLAERLLSDVLNFSEDDIEEAACHYEHILDKDAVDSVCTLLGHPRTCPHGRPIPTGRCCELGAKKFRPLVVPLTELEPMEEATVEYIGTRDNAQLAHLTSLGFLPGRKLTLVRKKPAFLVSVEESVIGLDYAVAREIFVRPEAGTLPPRKRHRGRGFFWSARKE